MPTPITLTDIAERGRVEIEHDAARGVPNPTGYAIRVLLGDRPLIRTELGTTEDLEEQLGVIAAVDARERVERGRYLWTFSPLEVMGLRGLILDRIINQDWSD
jgi:hypothetical protein